MNKGGLAKRLINFAGMFVGRISGGMGMTAIIACMLFAAISGSESPPPQPSAAS